MVSSYYTAQLSDAFLWGQLRIGDESALNELATRWYRPLFHYGAKLTANHALIEDTIQNLLLAIWEKRRDLPVANSVQAYLFASLRNNLLRHVKQEQAHARLTDFDDPVDSLADPESMYTQAEASEATTHRLQRALDHLPKRQREAVYLRYYESLSYDEIALVMGLNRQVVANYLQHALHNLRQNWPALLHPLLLVILAWV